MKTTLMCAALLLAPAAAWAANARHPYSNVNHANDAGNDTGDSQVEALNQAQLGRPGALPRGYAPQGYAPGGYVQRQPGYAPPQGPVGYAPPPAPYYYAPYAYAVPGPYYPGPAYVVPRPYW
jgi:hypothetical protein